MNPYETPPPWPHGTPPPPPLPPWIGGGPPRRSSGWNRVAIALAIVLGALGLLAVGAFVLFVISMNSYGSNK